MVKVTIFDRRSTTHYIPTSIPTIIFYKAIYASMWRYTKLYVAYNFRTDLTDNCDCAFGISKRF